MTIQVKNFRFKETFFLDRTFPLKKHTEVLIVATQEYALKKKKDNKSLFTSKQSNTKMAVILE